MLSKVSTTLGLSSASIAASESEFFMSSSSKSASLGVASPPSQSSSLPRSGAPLNGVTPAGPAGAAAVAPTPTPPEPPAAPTWPQHGGAGGGRPPRRRDDRLAVGPDHRRRHGLGIGTGIGRFEVDDVAQEDFALVELVAPNDDGLEGERALAQSSDHRF